MPLYEYRCEECNFEFEVRQKFSEAPKEECPKCGGKVKKLISQAAFTLKGGGWYQQGYVHKSSEGKADKPEPAKIDPPKPDPKPKAAKKETKPSSKVANG